MLFLYTEKRRTLLIAIFSIAHLLQNPNWGGEILIIKIN